MIDEKKLIEELASERTKAYIAYEMAREYWDKGYKDGLEFAIKKVNEQPTVGQWIPCSERLPEIAGVYRVTCLYDDKVYKVKDDLFYSDRTWGYDNRNRKVIAWKPLEKPYGVKENE